MNPFGLTFPLRIVVLEDVVKVVDPSDRVAGYIYIVAEPEHRKQTSRLSPEEGLAAAKVLARALTDAIMAAEVGMGEPRG